MSHKLLIPLCAMLIAGCATDAQRIVRPELPAGQTVVVPARFAPSLALNTYAEGKGAAATSRGAAGAGGGALFGAVIPLEMGPWGWLLYPYIAPVTIAAGAVVGGVAGTAEGAIHGLPEDQVSATRKLAQEAIGQEGIQKRMASLVAAKLGQRGHVMALATEGGPLDKADKPAYTALAKGDDGGVLEVAVMSLGMAAVKGTPPRVAVEVRLRTRLIKASQDRSGSERQLEYWSRPRTVADWVAKDNKLLFEEIKAALEALADETADAYSPIPLEEWWNATFRVRN